MQPSHFTIEYDLSIAENFLFSERRPSAIPGQYIMIFSPVTEDAQMLFSVIQVTVDQASNRIESVNAEDPSGIYYHVDVSPTDIQFILGYLQGA